MTPVVPAMEVNNRSLLCTNSNFKHVLQYVHFRVGRYGDFELGQNCGSNARALALPPRREKGGSENQGPPYFSTLNQCSACSPSASTLIWYDPSAASEFSLCESCRILPSVVWLSHCAIRIPLGSCWRIKEVRKYVRVAPRSQYRVKEAFVAFTRALTSSAMVLYCQFRRERRELACDTDNSVFERLSVTVRQQPGST